MRQNNGRPSERGVRIPKIVDEPTESIDIFTLFSRDITSTGSFDLGGVEQTSLGKLLRSLPMQAFLIDENSTIIFSNGSKEQNEDFSDPSHS
jgi:hypothetical protein